MTVFMLFNPIWEATSNSSELLINSCFKFPDTWVLEYLAGEESLEESIVLRSDLFGSLHNALQVLDLLA